MNQANSRDQTAFMLLGASAVAAGVGLLTPSLGTGGVLLLGLLISIAVALLLVRFRAGEYAAPHLLTLTLASAGVLAVTWNAVRIPGGIPLSDLMLLLAIVGLTFIALRGGSFIPLPGWLLTAALGLLTAGLLAELFVTNPPPISFPQGGGPDTQALARSNDIAAIARVELALLFVPVLIGTVAATPRRAQLVADLWLASAVVSAAVATIDFVGVTGIGQSLTPDIDFGGRQLGLTFHPNHLGLISGMTIPLALLRTLNARPGARVIPAAAGVMLLLGVLTSGSRTGVVVAVAAIALSALLLKQYRRKLLVVGAGVCCTVLVVALFSGSELSVVDRIGGNTETSLANSERVTQIERAIEVIGDHPFTGAGFARLPYAHTLVLQLLESGGIIALLSFGVFVVGVVALGLRLARSRVLSTKSAQLAAALTACICSWLVGTLTSPQLLERYLYVPTGVLLALWVVQTREVAKHDRLDGISDSDAGAGERGGRRSISRPAPVASGPVPLPR